MRIEYRITGKFRGSEKRHVVDYDRSWTKEQAESRFEELKLKSEYEMNNKCRKAEACGLISVGTPYYSDCDLLDLKLQSREVTPWSVVPTV